MIKDSKRFAELERLMSDYFVCHISPVMKSTKDYLGSKQADEMLEYSKSAHGILSMMATSNMPGGDPYQTLRYTGEWNSKTTEEYLAMCKERIVGNKQMQQDFAVMAGEWRKAVINEIGRERYDQLSNQLGCDLSYAYMDHRIEQLMVDKMVKDKMPKSSADYILRKAAQSSLFGLAYEMQKSPLTAEIEARGEAAYKPTKLEKGAGWTLGAAADAVALGGAGTWARFATYVGIDVAVNAAMSSKEKPAKADTTVEDCLSQGVFGSKKNVFTTLRAEGNKLKTSDSSFIKQTNVQLNKKTPTMSLPQMDWGKTQAASTAWMKPLPTAEDRNKKYANVPLIVASGKEEAFLKEQANLKAKKAEATQVAAAEIATQSVSEEQPVQTQATEQEETPAKTNSNGWDSLLQATGFDGFGNTLSRLPYVISMLPDVLVGMFTGNTKSLNLGNTFLPVASILLGLWIKNPILKMLLIGMGGANLINKAGKESLNWQREAANENASMTRNGAAQYRQYADEQLNPRITNPVLQGNALVANIDRVPCTIQLTQNVVDAYNAGALPLNTLANAVLAKYDAQQRAAQQYNQTESINNTETIHRTR